MDVRLRGRSGMDVTNPHWILLAHGSTLGRTAPLLRSDLHFLQRLGTCSNPLPKKNSCSPAENTNAAPQSAHLSFRSTKAMVDPFGISCRTQLDLASSSGKARPVRC